MKKIVDRFKDAANGLQGLIAGSKDMASHLKDLAISAGFVYIICVVLFKPDAIDNFLNRCGITNFKGDVAGMKVEFNREKKSDLNTTANFVEMKAVFDNLQETHKKIIGNEDPMQVKQLNMGMGEYISQLNNLLNRTDKDLKKGLIEKEHVGMETFKVEPDQVGWLYLGKCVDSKQKWYNGIQNIIQPCNQLKPDGVIDVTVDLFLRDPNSIKGEYSKQSPISVVKAGEKVQIIALDYVHGLYGGYVVWGKVNRMKGD